jgi:hypothetical protein
MKTSILNNPNQLRKQIKYDHLHDETFSYQKNDFRRRSSDSKI